MSVASAFDHADHAALASMHRPGKQRQREIERQGIAGDVRRIAPRIFGVVDRAQRAVGRKGSEVVEHQHAAIDGRNPGAGGVLDLVQAQRRGQPLPTSSQDRAQLGENVK